GKDPAADAVLMAQQRLLQARLAGLAARSDETTSLSPGSSAQVLNTATRPGSPVDPKPLRDTVLAALVGMLVGVAIAPVCGQIGPEPRALTEGASREARAGGLAGRELGEEL